MRGKWYFKVYQLDEIQTILIPSRINIQIFEITSNLYNDPERSRKIQNLKRYFNHLSQINQKCKNKCQTKKMVLSIDSQQRVRILEVFGETYTKFQLTTGLKEQGDDYIIMPNPYCGKSIYTQERIKISKKDFQQSMGKIVEIQCIFTHRKLKPYHFAHLIGPTEGYPWDYYNCKIVKILSNSSYFGQDW